MKKVLVIDDSDFQRNIIKGIVNTLQYDTDDTSNAQEAVSMVENGEYFCILCDLLMPIMDGYGFLTELREKKIDVPVVILTADRQNTTKEKCVELGAKDVINKPTKAEVLKEIFSTIDK